MASKKTLIEPTQPEPTPAALVGKFLTKYKAVIMLVALGFLGGFLWLAGMRFLLVKTPETHYHANFGVYINNVREEFKEFTYYEEVAACTSEYSNNPKGRVHMHDEVNDVIHVHDKRVTYGNFFQNIGWSVGDEYISTLDKIYQTDDNNKVTYMVNGETVDNIANRVIGNMDKLLVSYGPTDSNFMQQAESIASSAVEVNKYQDPATCGGLNGAGYDSFGKRLKRATFWE